MPNTCCIKGCKSNYLTTIKENGATPVYTFPEIRQDRILWLNAIGRADLVTVFEMYDEEEFEFQNGVKKKKKKKKPKIFICRKHWPSEMKTFKCRGKEKPIDPTSVFLSSISTQSPAVSSNLTSSSSSPPCPDSFPSTSIAKPRPTKRVLSSIRNSFPDELGPFLDQDQLIFEDIVKKLSGSDMVAFRIDDDRIGVQPRAFSPVPLFFIQIHRDLSFHAYHLGSLCNIKSLSTNNISKCKYWSTLEEIVRFLKSKDVDHKQKILLEQHEVMNSRKVGSIKYGPEVMTRAFEYYATSRALYKKIAADFELPCIRTLERITSKFGSHGESKFLDNVFTHHEERQRKCVLLLDEVYAKAALLLHGSSLFGKAVNNPSKLATTVLSLMLKSAFGGPEFIAKMLPVTKLDADFQFSQTMELNKNIIKVNSEILAIIVDGNRVNQKFFTNFTRVARKPWIAYMPEVNKLLYLLFDYVHVVDVK